MENSLQEKENQIMSVTPIAPPETSAESLPAVPLTVEGASVLHQMMKVRWPAWKALAAEKRAAIAGEAARLLAQMEQNVAGQSAVFSQFGHKGDLIFVHFRHSFEDL